MLLLCLGVEMNENKVERERGGWARRGGFRRRGHINFDVGRGIDFSFPENFNICCKATKVERGEREKKRLK